MATGKIGVLRRFRRANGDVWAIQVNGTLVVTWQLTKGKKSSESSAKDAKTVVHAEAMESRWIDAHTKQGYVQFSGAKPKPAPSPLKSLEAKAKKTVSTKIEETIAAIPKTHHRRVDAALAALGAVVAAKGMRLSLAAASPRESAKAAKALGVLPPSFARLLGAMSALRVETSNDEGMRILTADEMKQDTASLVRVPRGTTWEGAKGNKQRISTDHLVAFAAEMSLGPEARWCFSTDHTDARGELAIFLHHQDEPTAASILPSGAPFDPKRKPDHKDFPSWLSAMGVRLGKSRRARKT